MHADFSALPLAIVSLMILGAFIAYYASKALEAIFEEIENNRKIAEQNNYHDGRISK